MWSTHRSRGKSGMVLAASALQKPWGAVGKERRAWSARARSRSLHHGSMDSKGAEKGQQNTPMPCHLRHLALVL